ncbi:MAG: DUF1570 domain-containing protein, partial [Planctomycetia bacterium]
MPRLRTTVARRMILWTVILAATSPAVETAADQLSVTEKGVTRKASGRIAAEDQKRILFESRDGGYQILDRADVREIKREPKPPSRYTASELPAVLTKELGAGFSFHATPHFFVAYDCTPTLAKDAAALFERVYATFYRRINAAGQVTLTPSRGLLIAVIFKSRDGYSRYVEKNVDEGAARAEGVYSPMHNRLYFFEDSSGAVQAQRKEIDKNRREYQRLKDDPRFTDAQREELARLAEQLDAAEQELAGLARRFNVAVAAHESTHMLAFNLGLHERLSNQPKWFVEGMATFFEAPDLRTKSGWNTAGSLNAMRLQELRRAREAG